MIAGAGLSSWVFAALFVAGAAGGAQTGGSDPRATELESRLKLAKSDRFYLVLEPSRGTLTILYRGAILREYAVESVDVGARSLLFVEAASPAGWATRPWEEGRLDPPRERPRQEMHVTSQGVLVDETPAPPQDAEARASAPAHFRIEFPGGLTLEFGSPHEATGGMLSRAVGRMRGWWSGAANALARADEDRVRLRIRLASRDGEALYRSLPEGTGFVMISGT